LRQIDYDATHAVRGCVSGLRFVRAQNDVFNLALLNLVNKLAIA